jgi:hypothetical protein
MDWWAIGRGGPTTSLALLACRGAQRAKRAKRSPPPQERNPQDYCWMWSNETAATVELKVGFQR